MTEAKILHLREQLSDIYADYRNVCLNKKYYAERLQSARRWNRWYEIILAIGTSGTIAGWTIWKTDGGGSAWDFIGGIIAILVILKPIFKFSDEIERLTHLETAFNGIQMDFETLCFIIKSEQDLRSSTINQYRKMRERMKVLGEQEDCAPPEKDLLRLQKAVNREIPPERLWSPR